jgi:hypothetical protein
LPVVTTTITADRISRTGERTASITGLLLTGKVAFATVVTLTAKIKVTKCKLNITPENVTGPRSVRFNITTAVLGFLFLQEKRSYESIVGFTLIISSIILLTLQK